MEREETQQEDEPHLPASQAVPWGLGKDSAERRPSAGLGGGTTSEAKLVTSEETGAWCLSV